MSTNFSSRLHCLCEKGKWDQAMEYIMSPATRDLAREEAVKREGSNRWTPLTMSCVRASTDFLKLLVDLAPEAVEIPDQTSSLPLHFVACWRRSRWVLYVSCIHMLFWNIAVHRYSYHELILRMPKGLSGSFAFTYWSSASHTHIHQSMGTNTAAQRFRQQRFPQQQNRTHTAAAGTARCYQRWYVSPKTGCDDERPSPSFAPASCLWKWCAVPHHPPPHRCMAGRRTSPTQERRRASPNTFIRYLFS